MDVSNGIGPDWEAWKGVVLPVERYNFWNEPYAELFDWWPWMRPLYTKWEIDHDAEPAWLWLKAHSPWTPLAICAVYLSFCYIGPKVMASRKPFHLRGPLVAWNFLLAAFSFVGALRTVPHLANIISVYGFKYTICYKPSVWYGSGATGLWTQAFIFSKIPEFGDTVFVVLRKRPLIFLHWYHHVTVLLYCWHSYYEQTTYGLYFIGMNYTVHAFMYLYYGMAGMGIRLCKPYYITTMQISQMVVGIAVCFAGGYYIAKGETQFISIQNFQAGVVMYTSYMLLFLQYALGRFRPKGKKKIDNGPSNAAGLDARSSHIAATSKRQTRSQTQKLD